MHPNGHSLTHNVALWDLTPDSTVTTVITVITHHEVMARSNYDREIPDGPELINLHQVASALAGLFQADLNSPSTGDIG
jgi:hypothetical protein